MKSKALAGILAEIVISTAVALITESLAERLTAIKEAKKLKDLEKMDPVLWEELKTQYQGLENEMTFEEFLELRKLQTSLNG